MWRCDRVTGRRKEKGKRIKRKEEEDRGKLYYKSRLPSPVLYLWRCEWLVGLCEKGRREGSQEGRKEEKDKTTLTRPTCLPLPCLCDVTGRVELRGKEGQG